MTNPIQATYRLQFHAGFGFADGGALAPYLAALGVSHVYASPILEAREGSTHGYDVIDHTRVSGERGGEAGFRSMARDLRQHNIGILLDIVPNHMAVGRGDNGLWLDVLKHGRASRFASWFDIDFDCPDPELRGKVHAPFLDAPLSTVLANGGLRVARDEARGGFAVVHHDNVFPVRDADNALVEREGTAAFEDAGRLRALLANQNYVLDWWRSSGDRVNWRRFFDINELAALRMEDAGAFESAHAVAFGLYAEGIIDGLRVDHIDGLADPAAYCVALRSRLESLRARRPPERRADAPWIVVEKILAFDERVPDDWGVDGTTGYDFMGEVGALLHDEAGGPRLAEHWSAVSGRPAAFHDEETPARRQILDYGFGGPRERLVECLFEIAESPAATLPALRRSVASVMSRMRAYRAYATGAPGSPAPGRYFEAAMRAARDDPFAEVEALDVIAGALRSDGGDKRVEIARRFNQLAAPLAAKAVEDTSFYRYGRLLSRNEVGCDGDVFAMDAAAYCARMVERAEKWPRSLLATATHDHKRGEDARARLAAISEIPGEWIEAAAAWRELNAGIRPASIDAGDEYQFFQTIVGAWPLDLGVDDAGALAGFAERLARWRQKALREAKLRSGWMAPNERNENEWAAYIERMFDPAKSGAFLSRAEKFVARIAPAGAMNSLSQTALKLTCPGIPDFYQGAEMWDFSLVDPDNRRPVDYAFREASLRGGLAPAKAAAAWRDWRAKQALIARLLSLRRASPSLFARGGCEPVGVFGARRDRVVAFQRSFEDERLIVVAAVKCAEAVVGRDVVSPPAAWWGDTWVELPPTKGAWTRAADERGAEPGAMFPLAALGPLPLAVFVEKRAG